MIPPKRGQGCRRKLARQRSEVAETVRPEQYDEKPPLLAGYYTYWSGLPMDGRFERYIREDRGFAAAATHDFARMSAGTISPAAFFTQDNVDAIMAAAQDKQASG